MSLPVPWDKASLEMQARWTRQRGQIPFCALRLWGVGSSTCCEPHPTWWHPDVEAAWCELHVPTEMITHITRLWQEDEDIILAGVAYEDRELRRREIAARLGPKTIVWARPPPPGAIRRR